MHAKLPEIAKKWDKKYGGKISKKKDTGFYGHCKKQVLF